MTERGLLVPLMCPVSRVAAPRTNVASDEEGAALNRASGMVMPVVPTTFPEGPNTGAAIAIPPSMRSP
jgi:hypothetical protein